MVIKQEIYKLFRPTALISLVVLFFAANLTLLWNYSGIRHKVKIENGSANPLFQVVVITSGRAELFLTQEELEEYLKEHSDYSFLIPAGQEKIVQEQVVTSFKERYGGKGYPILKVQWLDASHQLIELYMSGDHHDDVFWYQASDKEIVPRYYMIFGIFDLMSVIGSAIVLTVIEYQSVVRLARFVPGPRMR